MAPLLIRTFGLPQAEVQLLKTILRLSTEVIGAWAFADQGRCDVLLVNGQMQDDTLADVGRPLVIRVGNRQSPRLGETLLRPIRAEEFIELLNDHYRARYGASSVAPSVQPPAPSAPPAAPAYDRHRKGMLTRWPSSSVLNGNKSYIRMATFLSRAPQSVNRLSVLSGMSADHCEAFMHLLDQRGLLRWQPSASSQAHMAPASKNREARSAGSAPVPAETSSRGGFLNSIRRRLGLLVRA